MRIMVDTNVIISAALFPSSSVNILLGKITSYHTLILCSQTIDELHRIFQKKFPDKMDALEEFLVKLAYEYYYTTKSIDKSKYPKIRDEADLPILVSATLSDADIFISGDKDFADVEIEKPEIMTPREFLDRY